MTLEQQTTERNELALKSLRDCHTKAHWEDFLFKFGELLATSPSAKLVTDAFKRLEADPQSLHYNPKIWGALLQGCIASWNTEIGVAVAEFCRKLTTTVVSTPAAQLLLEGGQPSRSRDFAQRALRQASIADLERIQLELIVASSFAEEGKIDHAVRILKKVSVTVRTAEMSQRERADFVMRLGRLQYFMGRYPAAAEAFEEASPIMLELHDWEGAARALFNAGACIQNGGIQGTEAATALVERCRKLSTEHNLWGPLSHCEAFYGVEAYSIGNYVAAKEHLRRAMAVLPANDKKFRRLHIMSFLSLTYFAMGRTSVAIKFGRQTLELAALDASDRFKTRYQSLEAEILWEEGQIPQSMALISDAVHQLELHGVKNLEELSLLARYQLQLELLGEPLTEKIKIDDSLTHSQTTWIEYLYSSALLRCSLEFFDDAMSALSEFFDRAKTLGALQYQALIPMAMIRLHLQRHDLSSAQALLPCVEAAVSRLGDTPIRAKLQIVYAAMAYQSGDFDRAVKLLHAIEKMSGVSWSDKFATQCCLATIRGESPRFQYKWQEQMVARFVRNYFAPTLKVVDSRTFLVSGHYTVSLEKHPAMADLMVYLIENMPDGATLSDIQTHVWHESVNAQGWQQKIRNAVMRVRDLFPYTIAPVMVHAEQLRFFGEAIKIIRDHDMDLPAEAKVCRILKSGPLSSQQIAAEIDVSLATAKRILKKLSDEKLVVASKQGRNVLYTNLLQLN